VWISDLPNFVLTGCGDSDRRVKTASGHRCLFEPIHLPSPSTTASNTSVDHLHARATTRYLWRVAHSHRWQQRSRHLPVRSLRSSFTTTCSSLTFQQLATPRTGTKISTSTVPIRESRLPSVSSNQTTWPKIGTMTSLIKHGFPLVLSRNNSLSFIPAIPKALLPRTGTTISKITINLPLALPESVPPLPTQKTGTKSLPPTNRRQRTGMMSLGTPRMRTRPTRRIGR
jgi:hypothetical protein